VCSATLRRAKYHVYRPANYKSYREYLGWLFKSAYDGELNDDRLYRVDIEIFHYSTQHIKGSHKGDIDNLTKPILDSVTGIIWKDDSQVGELHVKLHRERCGETSSATVKIYDIGYWHHYQTKVACINCGKEFRATHSRVKRGVVKYCSVTCMREYKRRKRNCKYCGKEFTFVKSAQRGTQFCSKGCYWNYVKEHPEEYKDARATGLAKARATPHPRGKDGRFMKPENVYLELHE
jgi:Holliday junction resolvase RusA-like endonuclease